MFNATRESRPAQAPVADGRKYGTVHAAAIHPAKAGIKHAARTPGHTCYRIWSACWWWPAPVVRKGGIKAGRVANYIPTNSLRKFHGTGQRLYWVERNAYSGLLRRLNPNESALACFAGNLHYRLSFFIGRGFLLTENGDSWRYTKLRSGHRISYGIGNNGSARNKSANGYRLKLAHSRRTQTVYEYGVYSSRHIHTGSSNLGYSTSFPFYLASLGPGLLICPGGLGGGDGRGGAGGLATKVSFLESVGKPRMGKKGGLGNQLSHMGGVV